ncbi:molybdopterin cofactor-binding domain-containing protein, partial [Acinetobacter baumannii]
ETTYEFPYLAHAAMEPMNCVVARRDDGTIEAWSAFQGPDIDQQAMAATAGVPPDKIKMHVLLAGGSFGRRTNLVADYPVETVAVAKAI